MLVLPMGDAGLTVGRSLSALSAAASLCVGAGCLLPTEREARLANGIGAVDGSWDDWTLRLFRGDCTLRGGASLDWCGDTWALAGVDGGRLTWGDCWVPGDGAWRLVWRSESRRG